MNDPEIIPMPDLFTRHPRKWRLVDTQTRQVWEWRDNTWKLAGQLSDPVTDECLTEIVE